MKTTLIATVVLILIPSIALAQKKEQEKEITQYDVDMFYTNRLKTAKKQLSGMKDESFRIIFEIESGDDAKCGGPEMEQSKIKTELAFRRNGLKVAKQDDLSATDVSLYVFCFRVHQNDEPSKTCVCHYQAEVSQFALSVKKNRFGKQVLKDFSGMVIWNADTMASKINSRFEEAAEKIVNEILKD